MKKNTVKAVLLAGVLGLAAAGGVSAYLTDYDGAANEFTVGSVNIELQEPRWEPDKYTKIEPYTDIVKDPQIRNTGLNDAFVYLEISVPAAEVTAAAQDGSRTEQKRQELFSFHADENWTVLDTKVSENSTVYVYAYNKILKPGEITVPVFESVRFLNITEGQLDGQKLDIPVRAYAIQTAYTGGDGSTVLEQAGEAYEKYANQNRNRDGRVTE